MTIKEKLYHGNITPVERKMTDVDIFKTLER